jgi:hypothetical protein
LATASTSAGIQRVGGDRQTPSKRVEKYDECLPPLIGAGASKLYRPVLECRLIGRELIEPDVISADQAQLLQARIGDRQPRL